MQTGSWIIDWHFLPEYFCYFALHMGLLLAMDIIGFGVYVGNGRIIEALSD